MNTPFCSLRPPDLPLATAISPGHKRQREGSKWLTIQDRLLEALSSKKGGEGTCKGQWKRVGTEKQGRGEKSKPGDLCGRREVRGPCQRLLDRMIHLVGSGRETGSARI